MRWPTRDIRSLTTLVGLLLEVLALCLAARPVLLAAPLRSVVRVGRVPRRWVAADMRMILGGLIALLLFSQCGPAILDGVDAANTAAEAAEGAGDAAEAAPGCAILPTPGECADVIGGVIDIFRAQGIRGADGIIRYPDGTTVNERTGEVSYSTGQVGRVDVARLSFTAGG